MEVFSPTDIKQIKSHGLSVEKTLAQLETFKEGIPFTKIKAPATVDAGIEKLSENELKFYAKKYDAEKPDAVKFVPASGAATRMFRELQVFFRKSALRLSDFARNRKDGLPREEFVKSFFENLPKFAFYEELLSKTKAQHPGFDVFPETEKEYLLAKTLLGEKTLDYSNLPKGLIPFHKYPYGNRTAFEEHFHEAVAYSAKNNVTKLHFTVSEKHLKKFQQEEKEILRKGDGFLWEKNTPIDFQVSYSFQQKSTDSIAVDMENKPFRDEKGSLVFRPSGHGALLENLNQIDADIVFIKNIDNVSTKENLLLVSLYKKALAGILLELQEEVFGLLDDLQGFQNPEGLDKARKPKIPTRSKKDLAGKGKLEKDIAVIFECAKTLIKEKLNVSYVPKNIAEAKDLLDRPIRVCGMVKNTGGPGGGPFWILRQARGRQQGELSLQIVETAQIDWENPQQKEILEKATHFNPVDLVCGIRNHKGKKFDLTKFSNPERGFISKKSLNGKDLKALELPGLWNGAMEYWNTVFVEVPQESFNPVKTVLDLLKPGHQGGGVEWT